MITWQADWPEARPQPAGPRRYREDLHGLASRVSRAALDLGMGMPDDAEATAIWTTLRDALTAIDTARAALST